MERRRRTQTQLLWGAAVLVAIVLTQVPGWLGWGDPLALIVRLAAGLIVLIGVGVVALAWARPVG
jgi:hypothetical protein